MGAGDFARELRAPDAVVINVHTPYESEIQGTDELIPYDRITGDPRLPADKSARLALYCRSGRMSAIAAQSLLRHGYTDVVELDGGMTAWRAAGRPLVTQQQ